MSHLYEKNIYSVIVTLYRRIFAGDGGGDSEKDGFLHGRPLFLGIVLAGI